MSLLTFLKKFEQKIKFLEEIHCYNSYPEEDMAPLTCISILNMAISEDKILNTELSCIKIYFSSTMTFDMTASKVRNSLRSRQLQSIAY